MKMLHGFYDMLHQLMIACDMKHRQTDSKLVANATKLYNADED